MGRSLDTMSGILSSLLDVNQLESGNLRPNKTDFAISEIFDSVLIDFYRVVAGKELRCGLVHSKLVVHSDRRMLEEMIRNLLSNAIRYTDRGKILLRLPARRRQGPDRGLGQRCRHRARSTASHFRGVLSGDG
jgi:signal transduction histidine kinase